MHMVDLNVLSPSPPNKETGGCPIQNSNGGSSRGGGGGGGGKGSMIPRAGTCTKLQDTSSKILSSYTIAHSGQFPNIFCYA